MDMQKKFRIGEKYRPESGIALTGKLNLAVCMLYADSRMNFLTLNQIHHRPTCYTLVAAARLFRRTCFYIRRKNNHYFEKNFVMN
jgi:hypothetical protein